MEGGGARVRADLSRRSRLTLLDQMSAITADGREHAGLTLDDILNLHKRTTAAAPPPPPPPPPPETPETPGRTLLDVIRDEDPKASSFKGFGGNRDKKSWRSFKERIRLKRSGSGAAWTSSVHVPTSDIMIPTSRSLLARRNSDRAFFSDSPPSSSSPRRRSLEMVMSQRIGEDDTEGNGANNNGNPSLRPQISRRTSCRFGDVPSVSNHNNDDDSDTGAPVNSISSGNSNPSLRPQISRRQSLRFSPSIDDAPEPPPPLPERDGSRRLSTVLAEERSLSAREAVAAQEAAEAASMAEAAEEEAAAESVAPARMSLMDLLEETDRQMGVVGSRYLFGDDDLEEEEEEEEAVETLVTAAGTAEKNCCVCMVRHKGAAFIPCGHTFCRLCSRELWVSRGNCPLCNGFILEILDIF